MMHVSRSLYRLHKMDTDLMDLQQKAEQRGHHRTVVECVRQRRAIERDRLAILDRLGLFKGFQLGGQNEDRPNRSAQRIHQILEAMLNPNTTDEDMDRLFKKDDEAVEELPETKLFPT